MTLDTFKLTGLATLIATVPVLAFAQLGVGDALGSAEGDIRAALEAQGAVILEIETEDGEIEVEYMLDGVEYEAEIDPTSGMVIALEIEDEDDDDFDSDNDDKDD